MSWYGEAGTGRSAQSIAPPLASSSATATFAGFVLPATVIVLVTALAAIGCTTLYSVAGGSLEPWAARHAVRYAGGLGVLAVCASLSLGFWRAASIPLFAAACAMLAAIPMLGVEAMGARRWLSAGGLSIQPVELAKIGLILILARLYAENARQSHAQAWRLPAALAAISVPAAMTVRQPDLGSAILLAGVGVVLLFLAGVRLRWFLVGAIAIVATIPLLPTLLHDYQRRRIEVFLDPALDPLGAGYHIAQARIALASGGWFGQGYLKGSQIQLDFVPEKMTDFVFVAFAEEWGLLGAACLLGLYAALIAVLLTMSAVCRDGFARLVIAGVGALLAIHVSVNVAMVTGLVPVVGIPLPFISYGGTSMLTLLLAIGIALSAWAARGGRRPAQ